jgi:hypothetical protein
MAIGRTTIEEVEQMFVEHIAFCDAAEFVAGHDEWQYLATGRVDER